MQTTQVQSFYPQEIICSKVNLRPAAKATDIDKLANDIEHHGQLQPVIIRFEDGKPAVIAGQRRRKALRKLCRKDPSVTLDGLVVDVDDMEATAISLSENKNQCRRWILIRRFPNWLSWVGTLRVFLRFIR